MMKHLQLPALLFIAATAPVAFAAASGDNQYNYELGFSPICNNGMEMTVDYISCDDEYTSGGSSVCRGGDELYAAGELTIGDSGLAGSTMIHRACLWGINLNYFCHDFEVREDFCTIFFSEYGADNNYKAYDEAGDEYYDYDNDEEDGNDSGSCPSTANTGPYKYSSELGLPDT